MDKKCKNADGNWKCSDGQVCDYDNDKCEDFDGDVEHIIVDGKVYIGSEETLGKIKKMMGDRTCHLDGEYQCFEDEVCSASTFKCREKAPAGSKQRKINFGNKTRTYIASNNALLDKVEKHYRNLGRDRTCDYDNIAKCEDDEFCNVDSKQCEDYDFSASTLSRKKIGQYTYIGSEDTLRKLQDEFAKNNSESIQISRKKTPPQEAIRVPAPVPAQYVPVQYAPTTVQKGYDFGTNRGCLDTGCDAGKYCKADTKNCVASLPAGGFFVTINGREIYGDPAALKSLCEYSNIPILFSKKSRGKIVGANISYEEAVADRQQSIAKHSALAPSPAMYNAPSPSMYNAPSPSMSINSGKKQPAKGHCANPETPECPPGKRCSAATGKCIDGKSYKAIKYNGRDVYGNADQLSKFVAEFGSDTTPSGSSLSGIPHTAGNPVVTQTFVSAVPENRGDVPLRIPSHPQQTTTSGDLIMPKINLGNQTELENNVLTHFKECLLKQLTP